MRTSPSSEVRSQTRRASGPAHQELGGFGGTQHSALGTQHFTLRFSLCTSHFYDAVLPLFLLSPAWCGGRRARMLVRDGATHPLAVRLDAGSLTLGEAFAFMSGLYF